MKHLPVRGFSVGFGILTLAWGVLDMSRSVLHLEYRPPILAILLALAGIMILVAAIRVAARSTGGQAPSP